MTQREELLAAARAEVGYKEKGNNKTKYGAWYGMDGQPWCAMFVSWCAAQAGIGEEIIPKLAYVPYIVSFYQRRGRWKLRGQYVPQPGDLIVYGSSSHIGIVENSDGKRVYTIEGNTSSGGNNANGDGCYRRTRMLSDGWIKGYCTPAYKEGEDEVKIIKVKIRNLDTGSIHEVDAINADGYNYIKLRDMEQAAEIEVGYDAATNTPTVRRKK